MFLGATWLRNISDVPRPQCLCSPMFVKIYSSVMFLGWPRNISYVPRPPTYVPRFLSKEHLSVSCSGCALGYQYKAIQWSPLACSIPAEVSLEVSVQITKGPHFHRVVLRRVHFFTHSFPTRWIPRASLNLLHRLVHQDMILPHTMRGRTHIGSWLHYFHGWSLHEPVLRFGSDD
jgi:hypothetical protein